MKENLYIAADTCCGKSCRQLREKGKMSEANTFRSLIDAISFRVQSDPQSRVIAFLTEDGKVHEVSNEQFYRDIRQYAQGIIVKGVKSGEIILLSLDHGYDLLCCFWGAVCCGAIPSILTYWRSGSDVDAYARKVKNLAETVRARAVISQPDLHPTISEALVKMGCLVFTAGEVSAVSADSCITLPELEEAQIALMQFTSGTTGEPKAIQFSHRAILDHVEASAHANQITRDCVYVSWLPFYHDMGLIGHIRSIIHGGLFVSMAPQAWLRHPDMLLKAIHHYRGTMTNMPNFGFDYCAQRIHKEDITGVDLSSWQVLSNGSEPVMPASMQRFSERFASYGFRPEALAVGYGMAENVMGVSVTPQGQMLRVDWVSVDELQKKNRAIRVEQGSSGARAVPSCGYPYRGIELAIVDEHWLKLAEREVGEIVIRSNTLFKGYYLEPKDSEGSFRKGWFRTGDIGYLADGQLYVCDRKKDLIIVGGRNIQPRAIESVAAGVFGESAGRCAAFGLMDSSMGTELPVLIVEMRKQLEDTEKQGLIRLVRNQVLDELDVAVSDVRLVPKGWVVKTTSGKIARSANREKYLHEVNIDKDKGPGVSPDELTCEEIKQHLVTLFEKILGIRDIGEQSDFFACRGDSLSALRLLLEIERKFSCEVSVSEFFQQPTVGHLTTILCRESIDGAGVETDAPLRLRSEYKLRHRIKARQQALLRHGLKGIKSLVVQKTWEIIPYLLHNKKHYRYLSTLNRGRLMRQFHELLESPLQGEEEFVQYGLMCHIPHSGKEKSNKQFFTQWFRDWSLQVDMTTLERAYLAGNGVIMVCWHSHSWVKRLAREFALKQLQPIAYGYIGHMRRLLPKGANALPIQEQQRLRSMLFLSQLKKSKSILTQGGMVSILPDGYGGLSRGISFPFHGRIRTFRAGFAELAVETGAPVIPVSLMMDHHARHMNISSLRPLEAGTGEMPRAKRVEGLVKQYVDFLKQEWARSPVLVPYKRMSNHINLPPIESST
jgi:acyl-CoA synthetase (AMP-forming)/AMP-acid ligase II/acyl carrier protein